MESTTHTNLVLDIIDEAIEEKSTGQEGFVIDNDNKAEWALRKIAEERADAQRYINVCKSMIMEYEEKVRKCEEKLAGKTAFLEEQLRQYLMSVPRKVTKTQECYKLPGGTLKLRHQPPEFKRDDALLMKWLKENQLDDLVKVEEKPNWSEIKKRIVITGDKAVTEDGQIVEGVEVVERPAVFEVDM